MKRALLALSLGLAASSLACVPSGSAPTQDAGVATAAPTATFRPSIGVMTAVFEDDFERAEAGTTDAGLLPTPDGRAKAPASKRDGGADEDAAADALTALLVDARAHEREGNLGPDWTQIRTTAWRIENGRLCGENARNHGVWLNKVLPVNARIEFDAIAYSDEGDLKTEVWGDGRSAATGISYNNATSYLAILGGWKNSLHVLARENEHGADRKVLRVEKDSDDPRQAPVREGQVYHFKVERTDGKTVHFFVDGVEYLTYVDPSPLAGAGHDHFGFNEWQAKTCYDNVKVTPL